MSKTKVTVTKSNSKTGPSGTAKIKSKKYDAPPLSIPLKNLPPDPSIVRLKQKSVRRNPPPGEDLKAIKEIIKNLRGETITVQEFVGLVSQYTGDKGADLKSVMEEDLASFRKLAKRIYDNMTQDVSDVLANEQIHITDYFKERYTMNLDKMMRTIDEIYRWVPNFDFEQYYKDKGYLARLFPLPKSQSDLTDPEELEMQNRQEAYHRLEWMRSEGVRLNQENTELQARLKELKQMQKRELMESRIREEEAEQRKGELEEAQIQLQERVEELNESLEKSIVENEQATRMKLDAKLTEPRAKAKMGVAKRRPLARKTQPWSVKAAQAIEQQGIEEAGASGLSTVSTTSVASKTGTVRKKVRPKINKRPSAPRDTSPFHYSPVKTPPLGPSSSRQTSPFHYSPSREALEPSVPTRTVRIESTTTTTEQAAPGTQAQVQHVRVGRRAYAPKDTWRGFQ